MCLPVRLKCYLTVPALLIGELVGGGTVWCRIFKVDIGLFSLALLRFRVLLFACVIVILLSHK